MTPLPSPEFRPRCSNQSCDRARQYLGRRTREGLPIWRKVCSHCHNLHTAGRLGLDSIAAIAAQRRGFDSAAEYRNSQHPYRQYRKDYCENLDSRLGYRCTHELRHKGQLQVDHIDGNPYNNHPENLQTLCLMCHYEKTIMCGDNKTAGRKRLKQNPMFTQLFDWAG
jgi:hypothetical protein